MAGMVQMEATQPPTPPPTNWMSVSSCVDWGWVSQVFTPWDKVQQRREVKRTWVFRLRARHPRLFVFASVSCVSRQSEKWEEKSEKSEQLLKHKPERNCCFETKIKKLIFSADMITCYSRTNQRPPNPFKEKNGLPLALRLDFWPAARNRRGCPA